MAGAYRPDVALLDIAVPGMSGYEVACVLREGLNHESPVLEALNGFASEKDPRQSRAAGFSYHLLKPVDLDARETAVRKGPLAGDRR